MSTHPNAILLLVLTPDDLARKTYRALMEEAGIDEDGQFKIGNRGYNHLVMEDSYDDGWQIAAKEGSIVLHDFLTYGYGDRVPWAEVETRKAALEEWAKRICAEHHCSYEISVGANYW